MRCKHVFLTPTQDGYMKQPSAILMYLQARHLLDSASFLLQYVDGKTKMFRDVRVDNAETGTDPAESGPRHPLIAVCSRETADNVSL